MPGYFRCSHSGLLFPDDYMKQWGRKYGIGLGPVPCSEVLDTDYLMAPPKEYRHDQDRTHPVGVTRAQLDYVEFSTPAAPEDMAILDADDPGYIKRMDIIRTKQKANPASKIYEAPLIV